MCKKGVKIPKWQTSQTRTDNEMTKVFIMKIPKWQSTKRKMTKGAI
jgi:hypothetical protein